MDEAGEELLGLLDGMPLALAQAAAYLRETSLDIASYIQLYTEQWDDLMKSEEGDLPLADYERSVGTTWTISFKAIKARSESAANLVYIWAFLSNQDLWHGLLQASPDSKQWPGWLSGMADNKVKFIDAVRLLLRYSMVEAQESVQGSYMMHPVVHKWTAHIQDGREKREFLRLAMMVVGSMVPSNTTKDYWVL